MLVIHRVERHDAFHVGRCQLEHLGHFGNRVFAHPSALALHDPQCGKKPCHLRWIAAQQIVELASRIACKYRHIRLVPVTVV